MEGLRNSRLSVLRDEDASTSGSERRSVRRRIWVSDVASLVSIVLEVAVRRIDELACLHRIYLCAALEISSISRSFVAQMARTTYRLCVKCHPVVHDVIDTLERIDFATNGPAGRGRPEGWPDGALEECE